MKIILTPYFIVISIMITTKTYGQEEIKGTFKLFLNQERQSKNQKVPIILEEEQIKIDTLYKYDGKFVTKEVKKFVPINPNFSFKEINPNFKYPKINVDISQKENIVIIETKSDVAKEFKAYNNKNQRLVIDVSNGVKFTKNSIIVSAMTIPIKVYLINKSDSLKSFTNNIESDVNIAFTIGGKREKILFKKDKEEKITNTHAFFGFLGINKLTLNKSNTDSKHDGNNILSFSNGFGYQYGYGKLGISFLIGIDVPTSAYGKDWVFRYRPWLGIGIGYSIFK